MRLITSHPLCRLPGWRTFGPHRSRGPPHDVDADALLDVRLELLERLLVLLAKIVTLEELNDRLDVVIDEDGDELGVELRVEDDESELIPAVTMVV